MISLERNGYAPDAVKAALHASKRHWSFRYELYDRTGKFKKILTSVTGGVVEYSALADIKRTARFELEEDRDIDWLNDRVKPVALLLMPGGGYAEFPMGVFLLATAPRRVTTKRVTRSVEAYDLAQILVDDKVESRYTVQAGADYITGANGVRALLESAGITEHNLTAVNKGLPSTRDWPPGTPKLKIINDLLSSINYTPLWFDGDGVAVAAPYVSPVEQASEYTYADDGQSVMFVDVEQSLDLWQVPNKWVLVVSEEDRAVLRSEYTNANPESITSTVSRGRTIVDFREVDAESQTALDAMAKRIAFEASQVYETVQFSTRLMPIHSHRDVYTVTRSELGSAKYAEVHWAMELKHDAVMKHVARRVVAV